MRAVRPRQAARERQGASRAAASSTSHAGPVGAGDVGGGRSSTAARRRFWSSAWFSQRPSSPAGTEQPPRRQTGALVGRTAARVTGSPRWLARRECALPALGAGGGDLHQGGRVQPPTRTLHAARCPGSPPPATLRGAERAGLAPGTRDGVCGAVSPATAHGGRRPGTLAGRQRALRGRQRRRSPPKRRGGTWGHGWRSRGRSGPVSWACALETGREGQTPALRHRAPGELAAGKPRGAPRAPRGRDDPGVRLPAHGRRGRGRSGSHAPRRTVSLATWPQGAHCAPGARTRAGSRRLAQQVPA